MYLTLPVHKTDRQISIEECLAKFVETEILDGDNAWNCPKCKKNRRATKTLTIAKLPTVLLIHLKRFSFNGPFRDKVDTLVKFPTM
jgi:ubiquitin carboxyl-terminal hydrolase 8